MTVAPAAPTRADEATPGPRSFLYSFPFLLLVTIVGGVLGELVYLALRETGLSRSLPLFVVITLPAFTAGAVYPYLLIRLVYRSSLRGFGVRWLTPGRPNLAWLLGSSAVAIALWLGFWGLLLVAFEFASEHTPEQLPMTTAEFHATNPLFMLMHGGFDSRLAAYLLHMFVFVGFAEELFGRGLLQNALDRRTPRVLGRGRFTVRVSTLLAAVLFAFWHTEWLSFDAKEILGSILMSMTIVLVPSLLLAVTYERTRSMLVVIVLHDVIDGGKFVTWSIWTELLPG